MNGWSGDFIDGLYNQWKRDPNAIDAQWNQFFLGFELALARSSGESAAPSTRSSTDATLANDAQRHVDRLIDAYRAIGHFAAQIDPLGTERPFPTALNLESFGLADGQLGDRFDPGSLPLTAPATLGEIVECLEATYCRTIGVEFYHLGSAEQRRWLEKRMETVRNRPTFSPELRLHLLEQLIEADGCEGFLEKRYIGKKRFGLEGGESLIPLLDQIVELAPANGVREISMGMAHRGRLNVLANILNKKWDQIFTEFEDAWADDFVAGGGDVKYHQGYSTDHTTSTGQVVHITLAGNPSHLEFVNSVVLGRCRAKQQLANDINRDQVIPILIHGDAALPGQGIVAECLNMMRLDGYTVGGTIHVVINNQVGFTTDPKDDWGGNYCTDLAKGFEAPIFHVNGDDVEACAWVARLAIEWRQTFKTDVFVDLVCYRKNGHNETDEPNYTQPLLYARVRKQKPVMQKYRDELTQAGLVTSERFTELHQRLVAGLDEAQSRTKQQPVLPRVKPFQSIWSGFESTYSPAVVDTGVPAERLRSIAKALGHVPESIGAHKTVTKLMQARAAAGDDDSAPIEWATAELLAYGSLLLEGHGIRLTGQDVERGTFSHRHAVVCCQETNLKYVALNHLGAAPGAAQAQIEVRNSPLSESSCVGFEYGYSLSDPRMLVIWEAQFGDFANSAQVLLDQFLASSEVKWKRSSGLCLLLPHGYEGQGPEHSSARLERFLQLCADDNMQVVYPSTTGQMFHLLRKQIKQRFRKPLIVMSPKSSLRLPAAMSKFNELVGGHFHAVLSDPLFSAGREGAFDPSAVTKVLLCSGKLAHELIAWRERTETRTTAVVRIEQLYPFPDAALTEVLKLYPKAERFVWVQEEPRNMGAYRFCQAQLQELCGIQVNFVGRPDSATPACASPKLHTAQQDKILLEAMGPSKAGAPKSAKAH
ncbi:MAG: 2-oxoglutarate dehydrogenase E1 component [Phycisphaerae bacterium]|nr:2-oxoglutarate dehydrogenase E1 component [Phycisphaerae bacterium]